MKCSRRFTISCSRTSKESQQIARKTHRSRLERIIPSLRLTAIMTCKPKDSPDTEGKFSCLIIEDDPGFASMAAQVVRGQGGEPTVAANLQQARDALLGRSFDLLLLDNHLPDGKGYDFFE